MTSKNLFFNLMKEDLKRRLWSIALASLVFFLSLPVFVAMAISNAGPNNSWIAEDIMNFLAPQPWLCVVAIVGSLICGMNGFAYLHSKQKVDLYHSMPVKRETIFAVHYVNGILIYVIPYLVSTLLALAIAAPTGYFEGLRPELFAAAFTGLGVNLVFYLLLYSLVVLAMLVSGNLVVGGLVYGIICGYGLAILGLKELMYSLFFSTYMDLWEHTGMLMKRLSPISWYFSNVMEAFQDEIPVPARVIAVTLIAAVIVTVLSLFVYKIRPSESAGKAMAFVKTRPVLKVMLTVPAALFIGIFFRSVTSSFKGLWYIFGLVFGLLVVGAIIEMVFRFDFKAAFHGKKSLAVSAVLVAVAACIFQFDIFGYDTWIPNKNRVEYMAIQDYSLDNGTELSNESDFLKVMQVTEFDALYELAKLGVKYDDTVFYNGSNARSYRIGYRLKSGRTVYRYYEAPGEEISAYYEAIYDNAKYKEGIFPFLKENSVEVRNIQARTLHQYESGLSTLSKADKIRLVEIYQKELKELSYEVAMNSRIVGTLQFETNKLHEEWAKYYSYQSENNWAYRAWEYPVYDCFTETLTILNAAGFSMDFTAYKDKVDHIELSAPYDEGKEKYPEDYEVYDEKGVHTESYGYSEEYLTISDRNEIEEILSVMAFYESYEQQVEEDPADIYIRVFFKSDESDYLESREGYFPVGKVPAFVKDLQK